MSKEKIFIFGCARSGTTLLQNLFRSFEDTIVIDRENPISRFEDFEGESKNIVLKRTSDCALTLIENLREVPDIQVVDIYRDPRDVVTSVHPRNIWILYRFFALEKRYYDSRRNIKISRETGKSKI